MMTIILYLFTSLWVADVEVPSKYVSRTGHLHVESHSTYLDVIADNYQVYCELVPSSGEVSIMGLTKSFEFKLGALDRAFNSDRVQLGEFAKFTYDGQITNLGQINFSKPGSYRVEVDGLLRVGSFKRKTLVSGLINVDASGQIKTDTNFRIRIEEQSVRTINRLMKEKLPSVIALDVDKLGVSRDIQLKLSASMPGR